MGYPDQALEKLNDALAEARALRHPFTLATSLSFAWIHQLRRDPQTALELIREGNALTQEYGFRFYQLMGMPVLGWAMAQAGKPLEGIATLEQTLGMMKSMGAVFLHNYFLGLLAECYAANGQIDDAYRTLDEALENAAEGSGRFYEAELYRMRGELFLSNDDPAQAEACFLKAVEIAHERELRLFELRAMVSLAQLWQGQGKTAEARDRLNHLYTWFTEGFDTRDLQEAKTLLNELV